MWTDAARSLATALRTPISPETRERLREAWERLPSSLRGSRQFLGRQYAGCGAVIGALPRCDFACRGCYLGTDANQTPPAPLEEVKRQLRRLRSWLGFGGNLQLTDGEITLRPVDELIELIRYARAIGLSPMLMSHGDGFRRDPHLLPRLVRDGGLGELSIHIDTTQRGRLGTRYRQARDEADLNPLRDEFAELVRRVRRETGRRLEVATTVTVTRENLRGVPSVLRWLCANADAFKMISFQPAASVGRTAPGLGGRIGMEELWGQIARGLSGSESARMALESSEGWLGHPACSRFVQGVVARRAGREPAFHPLFRSEDALEQRVLDRLLERWGGLTFRLDERPQRISRAIGLLLRTPGVIAFDLPRLLAHWARRLEPEAPLAFALAWLRGEARTDYLNVVSHHFMGVEEIDTPLGRERLAHCAFRIPLGETLVSMCAANALGGRERFYEALRSGPP